MVNFHLHLGGGVLEVELHALVCAIRTLDINPRHTKSESLLLSVNGLCPCVLLTDTPEQVYSFAIIKRCDVFHDRIASCGVAGESGDTPCVCSVSTRSNLATGNIDIHVRSVCKERNLLLVSAYCSVAILIRPVLNGGIPPRRRSSFFYQLIVHEIRSCLLVILLVLCVVGKDTEATTVCFGFNDFSVVYVSCFACTGSSALCIGFKENSLTVSLLSLLTLLLDGEIVA